MLYYKKADKLNFAYLPSQFQVCLLYTSTFNVAAAANADTKVAGAKIVVKNGDTTVATITTNDEGVASTALSARCV